MDPNLVFLTFEMDGSPIGLLPEPAAKQPASHDGRAGLKGNLMTKKNEGAFPDAPEQPLNKWLVEMARDRAAKQGIDFNTAFKQISSENPKIREAAQMEVGSQRDTERGPKFLQLMRRALEIMKANKGLSTEEAMERVAVQDPDLARAARQERGGSLYATDLKPAPGIGDRQVLMSEGPEAALDPDAYLVMLAERRCREKNISYRDALIEVGREHSDLVRAQRAQILGRELG